MGTGCGPDAVAAHSAWAMPVVARAGALALAPRCSPRRPELATHEDVSFRRAWWRRERSATVRDQTERVKCAFCGSSGPLSSEHAVPTWVRKAFDMRGPVTVSVAPEPGKSPEQVHVRPNLVLTVPGQVCSHCNNTWMALLEKQCKEFLLPMIMRHEKRTLSVGDQKLLATWAVKTVFMLELAFRYRYPGRRPILGYQLSEPELAWLWKKGEPPPRSRVWLACADCQFKTAVRYEHSGAPLPVPGRDPLVGHLTTIAIGFVALQVHTVNFVEAEEHRARWFLPPPCPATISKAIDPIWPDPIRTPNWPKACFAMDDWDRLVTWQGALRPQS